MPDRKLIVQIVGDDSSLHRAFNRSSRDAQSWGKSIDRAARGGIVATVGFRGLGRSVAFASGAFLGGAGFIAVAKSSVNAASDLNEQLNKTDVLFKGSANSVKAWSQTTATSFGISQRAALEAAGGIGEMLETAGLTSNEAAKFSRRLVELAADMASFNNIDPSEALDKLRSGLAGEARPLREVGVLLSETRVKQEAYRLGIAKAGTELTDQQKVLARYQIILKDTAVQQGDFARTSGGLANQQRILAAQVENLQAVLGKALLPDVLRVVKALNVWLSSSENQEKLQRAVTSAVKSADQAFKAFLDIIVPLAKAAQSLANALGGTRSAIRLLIAAMVAQRVVAFAASFSGLEARAAKAEGRMAALRLSLLKLAAIGVITIGIEIILHKHQIEKSVDDFLKKNISALAPKRIDIPVNMTLPDLRRSRAELVAVVGEGDLMVKVLDKWIEHLQAINNLRLTRAEDNVHRLRRALDNVKGKTVEVAVVQQGLTKVTKQIAGIKGKSVDVKIIQQGVEALQAKLDSFHGQRVPVEFFEQGLRDIERRLLALRAKRVAVRVTQTGLKKIQDDLAKVGDKGVDISLELKNLKQIQHDLAGIKNKTVSIVVLEEGIRELQAKLKGVKGKDVRMRVLEEGIAELERRLTAVTHDRTVKVHVEVDPAQGIVDDILAPLKQAQALAQGIIDKAKLAAGRSGRRFKAGADRRDLELDQAATRGAQAELKEISRQEAIVQEQIRVQGHTVALDRQLFELEQRRTQAQKDIADQRKQAAEAAVQARDSLFQAKLERIQSKIDRLDSRGQLRRELAALNEEERAVRAEIRAEGKTAALEQELASIEQKRAEIRKRIVEAQRQRTQARQFQQLGLDESGQERLASTATLKKRVASLKEAIKGTTLDTSKTRSELNRIARVLSGAFGKVGRDVRAAIVQMLNDITSALQEGGGKKAPLTKFKKQGFNALLDGLGLSPDQVKELRSRLEQRGPGGVVPSKGTSAFGVAVAPAQATISGSGNFIINGPITVVAPDPDELQRQLQRKAQRSRASRRGVRAGKNRGLA